MVMSRDQIELRGRCEWFDLICTECGGISYAYQGTKADYALLCQNYNCANWSQVVHINDSDGHMKYPPAKAGGFPPDSNIRVSIGLFQSLRMLMFLALLSQRICIMHFLKKSYFILLDGSHSSHPLKQVGFLPPQR